MGVLQELLDQYGASDDHMQALIDDIAILTGKMHTGNPYQELTVETRRRCAAAFQEHLQQMNAPTRSWFHAMELMDMYCHSTRDMDMALIPSACLAISILVGKLEGANTYRLERSIHDMEAPNLIFQKESEILGVLGGHIACPTICSWLNIFLPRLSLKIADRQWLPLLYRLCPYYAGLLVTRNACIPDAKLRHIAQGLIGKACVATAKHFGSVIAGAHELPEELQTNILASIDADMETFTGDIQMVELLLDMASPGSQSN